mmetsp:Transcript_50869/g.122627  ORF Transcript_50869/g.122627 Transcript_50869/m.122627 type:complete len:276 (+) Transcript_50869:255-1082(+)
MYLENGSEIGIYLRRDFARCWVVLDTIHSHPLSHITNRLHRSPTISITTTARVSLKEDAVDEDRHSNEDPFLVSGCVFREVHLKRICISKDLSCRAFGLLENNTKIRCISVRIAGFCIVNTEGTLATTLSTGISFCTTIYTQPSTASWSVDKVDLLPFMVKYPERRDTPPTGFLNGTELCPTTRHGRSLVTAAFATRYAALTRSFDRDHFCLRVKFLHGHLPMKAWLTPAARAEIGFLEGMEDLVATDEVLELSLGLTSENLLETSTTRLAHPVQ